MLKTIGIATGLVALLLTTAAAAQDRGFGQRRVGGQMCTEGSLNGCKSCCKRNNRGQACIDSCEAAWKGKASPKSGPRLKPAKQE